MVKRKDHVIAILNDTYEEGDDDATDSINTEPQKSTDVPLFTQDDEVSVKLEEEFKKDFNEVVDLGNVQIGMDSSIRSNSESSQAVL